jgi:RNA polymerase sigma-70 factor (ECF subfamily)
LRILFQRSQNERRFFDLVAITFENSFMQVSTHDEHESLVLLQQVRQGKQEALGVLLEQLRPWLRVMAQGLMASDLVARVDASDIVQQTCLSVHKRIQQFQGGDVAQFMAWVREVHRCNIHDELRRHITTEERAVGREVSWDASLRLSASGCRPSEQIQLNERSLQLASALEALPLSQRQVVTLRYLEGVSIADISSHLQITPDAVSSLLRRGIEKLRGKLGQP